jgi:hypothetical protein
MTMYVVYFTVRYTVWKLLMEYGKKWGLPFKRIGDDVIAQKWMTS